MTTVQPSFTRFGRYRILKELGRGAMGIVYLCEDESLQREVAVKALLLAADSRDMAEHEARFRQEAKAAGGLNHPNVITIHDLGREGDWLYIAMELLQGMELRDLLKQGPLPPALAADIAAQVARGLAAAHGRGVVHRDIKPSNIMVVGERHAKVMDFGVARVQASELRTRTGVLIGSPKYMSPEQVGGHPVDHRSDIFSLGSVLYEMVTGRPPFSGEELPKLLNDILHGTPLPASSVRPDLPPALDQIIARCMEKNAAARYQDGRDLARELMEFRSTLVADGTIVGPAIDPFEATMAYGSGYTMTVAAPGVAGPSGLVPAPGFDSTGALERLVRDVESGRPDQPEPESALDRRGRAWRWAFAVAALGAIIIAFA